MLLWVKGPEPRCIFPTLAELITKPLVAYILHNNGWFWNMISASIEYYIAAGSVSPERFMSLKAFSNKVLTCPSDLLDIFWLLAWTKIVGAHPPLSHNSILRSLTPKDFNLCMQETQELVERQLVGRMLLQYLQLVYTVYSAIASAWVRSCSHFQVAV